MAKKKTKSLQKRTEELISRNKLVTGIVVLVLIVVGMFAYNAYEDWDNAQLIRGLSEDFPALVVEIEQSTGLELEQQNNCMVTTEKFSEGVRVCELLITKSIEDDSVRSGFINAIEESTFRKSDEYTNNKGFDYKFRNANACGLGIEARGKDIMSFSCVTAVRQANIDLARELFLNE